MGGNQIDGGIDDERAPIGCGHRHLPWFADTGSSTTVEDEEVVMEPGGLVLDSDQQRAVARLRELLDKHGAPIKRHRGIYLHGRPGRGKTMVMNRFFADIASERKRRYHFHEFFAQLHTAAHEYGSIGKAIDTLLGNARLVCFDEFHVHDIGDAMLIARMLDDLFARRIVLVVTSNYPPEELLPNPLFHDKFLPAIAKIVAHMDLVTLDGPLDYRTRGHAEREFATGRYLLGDAAVTGVVDLPIGARKLRARTIENEALAIDFANICGAPTSAADYVQLAKRFRHWTLCDIPPLRTVPPDWAMRLVNLVDVLYDADIELTVYAQVPLSDLIDGVLGVPDIARAASRLGELAQPAPATTR
ncbi:cell division protein ZapE [Nocardia sp. NPDC052566]|uniref:cell division protein ZapE n=1 Tax=Nocardia sp. NPDC052566 TaxID=3364330 RepID=UPI0037C7B51A